MSVRELSLWRTLEALTTGLAICPALAALTHRHSARPAQQRMRPSVPVAVDRPLRARPVLVWHMRTLVGDREKSLEQE